MIRPLLNRVLLKPAEVESKTAGGIIIPDNNSEKTSEGEIIAVGPGFRKSDGGFAPLDIKVGDNVCFKKHAGNPLKKNGVSYLVLTESEVLGVLL